MKNIKNIEKKWIKNFGILKFIFPNIASIFLFITIFFLSFFILNKFFSIKISQLNKIPINFDITKKNSFFNEIIMNAEIEQYTIYTANKIDNYRKKFSDGKTPIFQQNLIIPYSLRGDEFKKNYNNLLELPNGAYQNLVQIVSKELYFDDNCNQMVLQFEISNIESFKFNVDVNYKGSEKIEYNLQNDLVKKRGIIKINENIDRCQVAIFKSIENQFAKIYIVTLKATLKFIDFEISKINEKISNLKKEQYSKAIINEQLEIFEYMKADLDDNTRLLNKMLVEYENNNLKKIKLNNTSSTIIENYKIGKSTYYDKNMLFIIISIMIGIFLNLLIDLIVKINSNKKRIYFD
jgi:hypothetical protein